MPWLRKSTLYGNALTPYKGSFMFSTQHLHMPPVCLTRWGCSLEMLCGFSASPTALIPSVSSGAEQAELHCHQRQRRQGMENSSSLAFELLTVEHTNVLPATTLAPARHSPKSQWKVSHCEHHLCFLTRLLGAQTVFSFFFQHKPIWWQSGWMIIKHLLKVSAGLNRWHWELKFIARQEILNT